MFIWLSHKVVNAADIFSKSVFFLTSKGSKPTLENTQPYIDKTVTQN